MQDQLQAIRQQATPPDAQALYEAVGAVSQGQGEAQATLCGAMLWASFAAPAAIPGVFDVIADAQLKKPLRPVDLDVEEAELPASFWPVFEQTVEGPEEGYDATSITVAVASLGAALNPGYLALAEAAFTHHPGAQGAAERTVPPMIEPETLAANPDGSLARALHSMLVDNGFDAEVLDRETIGLSMLSPATRYLNTRILQMHDIWHLVAGYETTSLHEMAISAFQLAQFGHNYSAMFLATVASMGHMETPQAMGLLLQNTAEAWDHGRTCPSLMEIEWEAEWHLEIDAVRAKYGIEPFKGSFPANLLEQLAA